MSDPRMIIKMIKIKLALMRLSRAKENGVRLHYGYPPIIPWYERITIWLFRRIRIFLIELFCPCCIYDRNRHLRVREVPSSGCRRAFHAGTHEHEMLKHFLGFFSGIFLGVFLYLVMIFQSNYEPPVALTIGVILSPIFTLGLAFSMEVRCVILLMIPQFFSSKGRSFLLLYAMILVMTYPAANFNKNIKIMSNSITCGQELAYNQSKEAMDKISNPLAGALGTIRATIKALKRFAEKIRDAFNALKTAIQEIAALFKKVAKWIGSIFKICDERMSAPYRRCKAIFQNAESSCRETLGWFLGWICNIVEAASLVCNIARITELLCVIAAAIKSLAKAAIYTPIKSAITDIKNMFYFNVTLNYTYEYNATQSKSYTEVKDGILKDVNERLSGYVFVLGLLKNVMMVSLIFVVIKALIYKKKFQTNDKFDNIYITFKLRDVEERRIELGKEGIFPLTWKEEKKYIKTRSPGMALREIKALAKGLFLLLISGCHTGFYLLCDYGLYWLLNMLKGFFSKKIAAPIPPHLKIHVHGKGSLSDMYRSLLTSFDPMAMEGGKLKPAGCIPTPSIPNWRIYRQIGFIYLVCLLMTIFQAYGLRLRHVIGACYYPRRERARAVWLYNHILKTRGGFLKFARRQLRRKAGVLKEEEKISIRSRLMAQFPLCRRFFSFLGFKRKHCLSCGNEGRFDDNVNFHHCQNKDCEAVYCLDCFTDLNNMCTVCMNPVDYGDHSDISEERDSSEDEKEMLKRRAEAEKLRQEREIQLQKRRPSEQMREMRKQFGITESVIKIRAEAGVKGQKDGAAYEEGYYEFEEYYEEGEDVDLKEKEFLSYQDIRRVEDEYDDGEYDADDDKSQTDYVTDDIFDDGEDDFIGDYDYPYIEPEELDMDRDIVSKTKLEV